MYVVVSNFDVAHFLDWPKNSLPNEIDNDTISLDDHFN